MSWRNTVFPDGHFVSFQDLYGLIEPLHERSLAVSSAGWGFETKFFQHYSGAAMPVNAYDYYWWREFVAAFNTQLNYIMPYFINHTKPLPEGYLLSFWSRESIFEYLQEEPVALPEAGGFTLSWSIDWGRQMYRVLNLLRWTRGIWRREHRKIEIWPVDNDYTIRWGYGVGAGRLPEQPWGRSGEPSSERLICSCFSDLNTHAISYDLVQGRIRTIVRDYFKRATAPAPGSVELHLRVQELERNAQIFYNAYPEEPAVEKQHLMCCPVCSLKTDEGFEAEPLTLKMIPSEAVEEWLMAYGAEKGSIVMPDNAGIFCYLEVKYMIIKHELVPDFRYFDP